MNDADDNDPCVVVLTGRVLQIRAVRIASGKVPVSKFLSDLKAKKPKEWAKTWALIQRLANVGSISNDEKFKKLEKGLWELKSYQTRIACFFEDKRLYLAHGITKKQNKWQSADLETARKRKKEHETEHRK